MQNHGFASPPPYYRGTPKDDFLAGSNTVPTPARTASPNSSITEKERPGRWLRFSGVLRRFWVLEVLWCFVGLGSAAAIIAVLAQYDGQKAPEWPLGVSLNTFLAFLASLAKAALLIPVTEGLGQLRWIWFTRKARRADDFELFDSATRGTFGSFRLLISLKGGLLGFVAALVTVASLMVSTVTQAAIQYESRPFPSDQAVEVPRITVFSSDQFFLDRTERTYLRSLNLKQHITTGAYTPADQTVPSDPLACSTGECEFPDFVTVGICSDVADVSPFLKTNNPPPRDWNMPGLPYNKTWSAALPWGQNLTVPTVYAMDFWATRDFAPTIAFKSLQNQSFSNIYLIYSNVMDIETDSPRLGFGAIEIVWYWCAKSYSVGVSGGQIHMKETSRSTKVLNDTTEAVNVSRNRKFWGCSFEISPKKCEESSWGNLTLAPPPSHEDHPPLIVDELTSLGVSSYLSMSFWDGVTSPLVTVNLTASSEGMFRALGRRFFRIQGDLTMAFAVNMWRDLWGSVDPKTQVPVLKNLTANIGQGLENFIRSDWRVHPLTAVPVNGTVFVSTPFVIIRWPWLAYLFVEIVLSSLFLFCIITWTTSTKSEALRVSTLATLCALDAPTRQALGHIGEHEGIRRRAGELEVMMLDGDDGLALRGVR
ncbi:hypothetical protein B0T16DRAFT_406744 [Cercophora newfieldiana]|uniref:Uncharacterized protein n=1 Tax=Cercophora newfieldiana TaxID=92897 RepID=A0AA39YHK3_9PEZI|nr:hypothetical protein B0T16DRAFT_406744 [Cercophora newfieldiana]